MEVKKYNPRKFASPIVGTFARHFGLNAMNNTTIEAELPAELAAQARAFDAEGWATDFPNWQASENALRELRKKVTIAVFAETDDLERVTALVDESFTLLEKAKGI